MSSAPNDASALDLAAGSAVSLIRRWRADAAQYQRQVEESRAKGLPYDQMLSLTTALRQCAVELERILPSNIPDEPRRRRWL